MYYTLSFNNNYFDNTIYVCIMVYTNKRIFKKLCTKIKIFQTKISLSFSVELKLMLKLKMKNPYKKSLCICTYK